MLEIFQRLEVAEFYERIIAEYKGSEVGRGEMKGG